MNPRDITPKIYGLPGLPKWLDLPFIKRTAEEYGITKEEAREHIRLNTLQELSTAIGENRGNRHENECRAEDCIQVDRESLSTEPKDAPESCVEDGW